MPNVHGIPDAELGVLANLRSLRGRTRGPHRVMKRLGGNHRALDAVLIERFLNLGDDLALPLRAHRLGRNHVAIMSGPVADADFGILADNLAKADLRTRG